MKDTSLELSLKVNCMRILEILEEKNLEQIKTETKDKWGFSRTEECIELRDRMHQLRKDTLKVEKILYPRGER